LDDKALDSIIRRALAEDGARRDITSRNLLPRETFCKAVFVAKSSGILCGLDFASRCFQSLSSQTKLTTALKDGAQLVAGTRIAIVSGSATAILGGERIALNLLQRLSGIATTTRAIADNLKGTPCVVKDTRKTTPGLRELERYAVRVGGGVNHRFSLSDMILVKDNHIALCGSVSEAVRRLSHKKPRAAIEIEVSCLPMLEELIGALKQMPLPTLQWVLFDNFKPSKVKRGIQLLKSAFGKRHPKVECSGNITTRNARAYALAGADAVSSGALTHSANALDISLEML
jgi:nicotinate-nucleotide pyrophosphorylase (carboxylating)